MDIRMDVTLGDNYHSARQKTRVITETWAAENMYCVMCGAPRLEHLQNNKPVADLCCPHCRNFGEPDESATKEYTNSLTAEFDDE